MSDAHDWDDIEGVRYHYPTKYRNKINEGDRFIYYQGTNRVGGKRAPAEYFGTGTIGKIWQDPSPERQSGNKKAWYCAIEVYERFRQPVPAKIDNQNIEQGAANLFRDGVRVPDQDTFDRILNLANISMDQGEPNEGFPPPSETEPSLAKNLLIETNAGAEGGGGGRFGSSKNAKAIGDWAEQLVLDQILKIPGSSSHIHRAAIGEKPGWDLDYVDANGDLQRIEVKGTQAAAFRSIEITANELAAAEKHGVGYSLYLVARCRSQSPAMQIIVNPAALIDGGSWSVTPTSYRLAFNKGE